MADPCLDGALRWDLTFFFELRFNEDSRQCSEKRTRELAKQAEVLKQKK